MVNSVLSLLSLLSLSLLSLFLSLSPPPLSFSRNRFSLGISAETLVAVPCASPAESGGGRRDRPPPPKMVNSVGKDDEAEICPRGGKLVDESDWKRGGRLRSNLQSKGKPMGCDDGYDDGSPERDDDLSLSPPSRCFVRPPIRDSSVRECLVAMSEACPLHSLKVDERVAPEIAPVHTPGMDVDTVDTPWSLADVEMAGTNVEVHGIAHTHEGVYVPQTKENRRSTPGLPKSDEDSSLCPPSRSFSRPPIRDPSVRECFDAMSESRPLQTLKIDERVAPKIAPVHSPGMDVDTVDTPWSLEDVDMAGTNVELHGNSHMHEDGHVHQVKENRSSTPSDLCQAMDVLCCLTLFFFSLRNEQWCHHRLLMQSSVSNRCTPPHGWPKMKIAGALLPNFSIDLGVVFYNIVAILFTQWAVFYSMCFYCTRMPSGLAFLFKYVVVTIGRLWQYSPYVV